MVDRFGFIDHLCQFVGRGLDPSTCDNPNPSGALGTPPPTSKFQMANGIGGVKTPPYSTIGKGDVGGDACIAPQAGARPSGPMTSIGPYSKDVEEFRPQRGQSGKREKSVKKNAALLHFLGFFPLTLLFGVPRGRALGGQNDGRQFAPQTRSCGYSPRGGEHCSLPSFATLNCGPLLATPQSPKAGLRGRAAIKAPVGL